MSNMQVYAQSLLNAAITAPSAWAMGLNPVGGAVLGATSIFSGRMLRLLQHKAGFPVTPSSSTTFKMTTYFLRYLANSSLVYGAANAVGFAISFQATFVILGIGFIGRFGIDKIWAYIRPAQSSST